MKKVFTSEHVEDQNTTFCVLRMPCGVEYCRKTAHLSQPVFGGTLEECRAYMAENAVCEEDWGFVSSVQYPCKYAGDSLMMVMVFGYAEGTRRDG